MMLRFNVDYAELADLNELFYQSSPRIARQYVKLMK